MARYAALSSSLPPLTSEDLYEFRFLTDAQISPDGERIAYAVRRSNDARDSYRGAIWLVPFGGRPARQVASGDRQDPSPRWSTDDRTTAFSSGRGAAPKRSNTAAP